MGMDWTDKGVFVGFPFKYIGFHKHHHRYPLQLSTNEPLHLSSQVIVISTSSGVMSTFYRNLRYFRFFSGCSSRRKNDYSFLAEIYLIDRLMVYTVNLILVYIVTFVIINIMRRRRKINQILYLKILETHLALS